MKIDKDTLIKYTLRDKNGSEISCTFTLEQVEGSSPSFYEQFKDSLSDIGEWFDLDSSEIVSREIVFEDELDEVSV